MGSLSVAEYPSFYLDTSLYIYFFEDHPVFAQDVQDILSEVIELKKPLFGSELLFSELLTLPYKENQQELVNLYQRLPTIIPSFRAVAVSREIAIGSARLRAKYDLRTPDAIHLATAIVCKASCFICSDKKLQKITEIKVLCL